MGLTFRLKSIEQSQARQALAKGGVRNHASPGSEDAHQGGVLGHASDHPAVLADLVK